MADSVTVPFQIFSGRAADRREISTSRAGVIGWGYSCVSNVSVWNEKQMVIWNWKQEWHDIMLYPYI